MVDRNVRVLILGFVIAIASCLAYQVVWAQERNEISEAESYIGELTEDNPFDIDGLYLYGYRSEFKDYNDFADNWMPYYSANDTIEVSKDNSLGIMAASGELIDDGMPHVSDPSAGEDRLIAGIEEIDVLKERYRQAVEYMAWFMPAWEQLSEDERYVLETFYDNEYGINLAVYTICEKYGIERSSAYNKKNRALNHLTVLLFGKG